MKKMVKKHEVMDLLQDHFDPKNTIACANSEVAARIGSFMARANFPFVSFVDPDDASRRK